MTAPLRRSTNAVARSNPPVEPRDVASSGSHKQQVWEIYPSSRFCATAVIGSVPINGHHIRSRSLSQINLYVAQLLYKQFLLYVLDYGRARCFDFLWTRYATLPCFALLLVLACMALVVLGFDLQCVETNRVSDAFLVRLAQQTGSVL